MNATFDAVRDILASQLAVEYNAVKPEARLTEDLGADSVDLLELVSKIEDKFEIKIAEEEAKKSLTVANVVTLIEQKLQTKIAG